jgi:hypothetical protein
MLIVTAENVTEEQAIVDARADGTAVYEVWAGINSHLIWRGCIKGHVRAKGAATLLRLIADKIEAAGEPMTADK